MMTSRILLVFIIGLVLQSAVLAQKKLPSIVSVLGNTNNFETMYQGVLDGGFGLTLGAGKGPYTLLVPTDDAFAQLSSETLQYLFKRENYQVLADLIGYHLLNGNLTADAIKKLNPPVKIPVNFGQSFLITENNGQLKINDANVIRTDIFADNGVIHVLDRVLLGPYGDITNVLTKNPNFQILYKALQAADLLTTLRGRGPFTLFAPTDYAFQKLPPGTLENLLKPENKLALFQLLTYHVVDGNMTSSALEALNTPSTITSFNRKTLRVAEYGKSLFINDATVVIRDMSATNGVIHGINQVLQPSNM